MESKSTGFSLRRLAVHLCNCLLLAGLATGCAFSRTPVTVNFGPAASQPVKTPAKASLEIGQIKDSRLVTDGMVLYQKSNAYGATSGAYVTQKPVVEVFRDGLTAALQQNGFIGAKPSKYELRADLQAAGVGFIQNAFSPSTAKAWLNVRFELVDKSTGLPVWHDSYEGHDSSPGPMWDDTGFITGEFSKTAGDVFKQLLSDAAFRSYFE